MGSNLADSLRRDRRTALREYSASLMSSAKWRTVFSALKDDRLGIRQILAKFIDVEEAKPMSLPWLHTPHAFVDSMEFGPFSLVEIEWIEVPAVAVFPRKDNVPAERYAQDIDATRFALEALGKRLLLLDTATGIRIVGHIR